MNKQERVLLMAGKLPRRTAAERRYHARLLAELHDEGVRTTAEIQRAAAARIGISARAAKSVVARAIPPFERKKRPHEKDLHPRVLEMEAANEAEHKVLRERQRALLESLMNQPNENRGD